MAFFELPPQFLVPGRIKELRFNPHVDDLYPLGGQTPLHGEATAVLADDDDTITATGAPSHQLLRCRTAERHLGSKHRRHKPGSALERQQERRHCTGYSVSEVDDIRAAQQQGRYAAQPDIRQKPGQVQQRLASQRHEGRRCAGRQPREQLKAMGLDAADTGRVTAGEKQDAGGRGQRASLRVEFKSNIGIV